MVLRSYVFRGLGFGGSQREGYGDEGLVLSFGNQRLTLRKNDRRRPLPPDTPRAVLRIQDGRPANTANTDDTVSIVIGDAQLGLRQSLPLFLGTSKTIIEGFCVVKGEQPVFVMA